MTPSPRRLPSPGVVEFTAADAVGIPCTPAQRSCWHALADPTLPPASRVLSRWLHLGGDLDRAALAAALRALLARHEALRLRFDGDGRSMRLAACDAFELRFDDLRTLSPAERETALAAMAAPAAVDPVTGPLLRACLVRTADAEHRLLLELHRLVCDVRTLQVLLADLGALYAQQVGRVGESMAAVPSFVDLAREVAGRPVDERSQREWQREIAGVLSAPCAPGASRARRGHCRRLDPALVRAFEAEVQRHGARRKSGWVAALAALLSGIGTAQSRAIPIPMPIAIAIAIEADEDAGRWPVGACAAVLPVALTIEPQASFASLLATVDRAIGAALRRAAPDVDDLLARLEPPAGVRWPVAPTVLRLRDSTAVPPFGDLPVQCPAGNDDAAEFALVVTLERGVGGPRLDWCGHARAVSRVQIERFVALLRLLLVDPQIDLQRALAGLPVFGIGTSRALPRAATIDGPRDAPLSPDQAACWFRSLQPGAAVPRHAVAHRLHGPLDGGVLAGAFERLLQRQQGLCLWFEALPDGRWQQAVQDVSRVLRPIVRALQRPEDLSRLDDGEREAVLHARLEASADAGFGGHGRGLLRVALFRLDPTEHVLLLVAHAALIDADVLPRMAGELAVLYRAGQEGAPARLPELPIEPIAWARWHAAWLHGSECEALREAWRQRLADWPARPPLPIDGGGECAGDGLASSRHESLPLPGWLAEALQRIASDAGADIEAVLLAAWAVWLSRACGTPHALIAVPGGRREGDPLHAVAGHFGRCLPLAIGLRDGRQHPLSFTALVARCQAALAALGSDDGALPQDDLCMPDGQPRCTAAFAFRDLRRLPAAWGSLHHEWIALPPATTGTAIELRVDGLADGLGGWISLPAERHLPESAALYRDQLLGLLLAIAADPQASVDRLSRPSAPERDRLAGWCVGGDVNDVGADALTARFRRICAKQPQAPAVVVIGERTCSYRQLARAIGNAAVWLRARVARDDVLAIALPAGVERIAGVLAGLSVAARCLLLDPAAPTAELRRWLDRSLLDGGTGRHRRWLLADPALARALRWPPERRIEPGLFEHDADIRAELLRAPCRSELLLPIGRGPSARVVALGERSLLALAHGLREWSMFGPGARVAAWSPPDSARHLVETLLPLLDGGCVLFARGPTRFDDWLAAVDDGGAAGDGKNTQGSRAPTVLIAPPEPWRRAIDDGWRGRATLTVIVDDCPAPPCAGIGSEHLVGRHLHAFGRGPAGVWSLFGAVDGAARVLPGRRVEVIDADGEWQPIGVYGELRLSVDSHDGATPATLLDGPARWRADGVLERPVDCATDVSARGHARGAHHGSQIAPPAATDALVVDLHPGRGIPLVVLHDDSGELSAWSELLRHWAVDVPVLGLRATPAIGDLRTHAAHLVDALQARQSLGPYRLAGTAIGGLVAIEMADQLEQRGARIGLLALVGAAPSPPRPWPVRMRRALQRLVAGEAAGLLADARRTWRRCWQHARDVATRTGSDAARGRRVMRVLARSLTRHRAAPYRGPIRVFTSSASAALPAGGWCSWLGIGRFEVTAIDAPADRLLARPATANALGAALHADGRAAAFATSRE